MVQELSEAIRVKQNAPESDEAPLVKLIYKRTVTRCRTTLRSDFVESSWNTVDLDFIVLVLSVIVRNGIWVVQSVLINSISTVLSVV